MKVLNVAHSPYRNVYDLQKEIHNKVVSKTEQDTLIVCSHPSVVTLGRSSTDSDLIGWSGDVEKIERGGKATYHGPSQVVIYPIIDLKNRGQNIAGFLSAMEKAMIQTLSDYDLNASGNTDRGKPDFTGVWVQTKDKKLKIASIGVAVSRWVTYHGLAFNLYDDPLAFTGINPCGFSTDTMTSLEKVIGKKIERKTFEQKLCTKLMALFNELSD